MRHFPVSLVAAISFLIANSMPVCGQDPIILKHDGWVAAVAFAPDGKTLASAGADNVVRLWEVGTWKPTGVLKGHTDCVSALAFNRHGRYLVTGSFDGSGVTRLYVTPGYRFRVVEGLLTNFHMPRSSLMVLVSAFAGRESIRAAYEDFLNRYPAKTSGVTAMGAKEASDRV